MIDSSPSIEKLIWIMSRLRDPDQGCPWDIKQNFASIVPYTLEEAYEVAEAIETQDYLALEKELGDLLFQVVFYSQLGAEDKLFTFDSVVAAICEKLIRRHPHVFASKQFTSDAEIKANWEAEKAKERQEKEADANLSILADIPNALPALSQAMKIQKRCAHVGFDWHNINDVMAKVEEEIVEVKQVLNDSNKSPELAEELGDLLFATVNLIRHAKQDPEKVLRSANKKFTNRFQLLEKITIQNEMQLTELTLNQLDALWNQVKANEKA